MWSSDDAQWLQANYPALQIEDDGTIRGRLIFRMLYDKGLRHVNPNPGRVGGSDGIYIADHYGVRIEWGKEGIPRAYEADGRLKLIVARKNIEPIDVHLFPDDSLCLANPLVIRRAVDSGMTLQAYIEDFLIPYFYAQHFFEENDVWPWGDLLHGAWGMVEWLGLLDEVGLDDIIETLAGVVNLVGIERTKILFSRRLRWYHKCICESDKRFRDCHPGIVTGVKIVRMARASRNICL